MDLIDHLAYQPFKVESLAVIIMLFGYDELNKLLTYGTIITDGITVGLNIQ